MPTPVPDPAILRYHGQLVDRNAHVVWSEHPAERLDGAPVLPVSSDGSRMVVAREGVSGSGIAGQIAGGDSHIPNEQRDKTVAATLARFWATSVPRHALVVICSAGRSGVITDTTHAAHSSTGTVRHHIVTPLYAPYPNRDGRIDCFDRDRRLHVVTEPVNQFGYTAPWRRQLAAAAAGLDLAWAGRYLSQNVATRTVVAQLMDGLIGSAWQQMGLWEGRHNAATSDTWQVEKPHIERRVDAVRAAVVGLHPDRWARLVATRIDVAAYAARLNVGQVPTLVASPTGRWQPGPSIVSVSIPDGATADERTAAVSTFHDGLSTAARLALEHHDASSWEHDHTPFSDDRHD